MKLLTGFSARWVAVVLLLAGSVWASSEGVQKARRIAGYACGDAPAWDAMNDEDRSYVGPTRNAPGEWFNQKNEMPQDIDSEKILNQAVYAMAYSLEPSRSFTVSSGVNEKLIRKWLGKINTSIYGQVGVTADDDKVTLTVSHTPESRIMAAFRNSAMEDRLVGKEKDVLQTCSEWISGNISKGMPNGLKLKKIHDALVDNSRYTKGCYSTAEIVLEGKGVCAAYTSAAQLLMHMLKIDCRRIYGTEKMNHVWNFLELDGEWYHMDVTWDDPNGNGDLRMYNYYLLTDVEMAADHDWVNADLYHDTPKVNPWHFPVRNDMRRSWIKGGNGYTLPREDESVTEAVYNMNLKEASIRGEQFANLMGKDVQRKEKAEDKLKMGKGSDPLDVAKRWSKYTPKVKKLKQGEEEEGVSDYEEFNEKLEGFAAKLADTGLVVKCKKNVSGWKMREIVGKSDINVYAEKYNAVFDEKNKTITLDIEYWSHVRVLNAAADDALVRKLTPGERRALSFCQAKAQAMPTGSLKRKRQLIRDLHVELIGEAKPISDPSGIGEFVKDHESHSLGYAQTMYVVLNMVEIPCIMVHGRVKTCCTFHDQVWNLVRLTRREWYHADSAFDDENGNDSAQSIKYCLKRDDEVKGDHAWDVMEIPPTPTKEEKEALKKLNPFSFGR